MSATAAQNVIAVVGIDIGKNSLHGVALAVHEHRLAGESGIGREDATRHQSVE